MLHDPIWLQLLKHGADCNVVYPEDSHKSSKDGLKIPALLSNKKKRASATSEVSKETQSSDDYRCTILINYVQHDELSEDQMLSTFRTLSHYGAQFDPVDSKGLTVLDHAIMKNNDAIARFILINPSGLSVDHRKPDGRTSVHICVRPLASGSFENVNLLKLLHEKGYDLAAKDNSQQMPLDIAMQMESKVMAKALCNLM